MMLEYLNKSSIPYITIIIIIIIITIMHLRTGEPHILMNLHENAFPCYVWDRTNSENLCTLNNDWWIKKFTIMVDD